MHEYALYTAGVCIGECLLISILLVDEPGYNSRRYRVSAENLREPQTQP